MSYDPSDAAWDEFFNQMNAELYPDHKDQAISEFTEERLQSFYIQHLDVMRPAVDALQEGKKLQENGHHSAALVFFVTAIELLLKATLLRPVVHGLIHNEALSEIIVKNTLGQSGFSRYDALLSNVFRELSGIELSSISRVGAKKYLLKECNEVQKLRNRIIHQGYFCSSEDSDHGKLVAVAVYELIVKPVIQSIGLWVGKGGSIVKA